MSLTGSGDGRREGGVAAITPLVDQLHHFCLGHEQRDRGAAAAEMLAHLRQSWPELPEAIVESDPGERHDAEELVLGIICDVGAVADVLLVGHDLERKLAWSRANLILDLERYASVVEGQGS